MRGQASAAGLCHGCLPNGVSKKLLRESWANSYRKTFAAQAAPHITSAEVGDGTGVAASPLLEAVALSVEGQTVHFPQAKITKLGFLLFSTKFLSSLCIFLEFKDRRHIRIIT